MRRRVFHDRDAATREKEVLIGEQLAEGFREVAPGVLHEVRDRWRDDHPDFDLGLLASAMDAELDERLEAFVRSRRSGRDAPEADWLAANIERTRSALVLMLRHPDFEVRSGVESILSMAAPAPNHLPAYLSLLSHPGPNHTDCGTSSPVELLVALGVPDRATESCLVELLSHGDFRIADRSAAVLATFCTHGIAESLLAHAHGWGRTSDGFAWAMLRASERCPHARFLEHLEWMHDASRRRGPSARFEKDYERARIVEAIESMKRRLG